MGRIYSSEVVYPLLISLLSEIRSDALVFKYGHPCLIREALRHLNLLFNSKILTFKWKIIYYAVSLELYNWSLFSFFLINDIIFRTLAHIFNQDVWSKRYKYKMMWLLKFKWTHSLKKKKSLILYSTLIFPTFLQSLPTLFFPFIICTSHFLSYNHWPDFLLLYHFLVFKEEKKSTIRELLGGDAIICYRMNLIE